MNPHIRTAALEHPYPLLFATLSGAHLYGFPSADSDYDLRGAHILPLPEVVGLETGPETIEQSGMRGGVEIDLVTHDVRKFFSLLLQRNGYVLEQLYSPLLVRGSPGYEELKVIASGCITRNHSHHYLGFAQNQWRLFQKEEPRQIKPLLYAFRVLLTGIHLMRTGEIEANLTRLNLDSGLSFLTGLIEEKAAGGEHACLQPGSLEQYEAEYLRLREALQVSATASSLPDAPVAGPTLNDLLLRLRLATP